MPIYFKGLNGLRAIAAIAVVIFHSIVAFKSFNLNPYILGTTQDGGPKGLLMAGFGVTIFFALSGFLITFLLLKEKDKQKINVRKFYYRRILRIWPLYYLYLLVVIIIMLSGYPQGTTNSESIYYYIFYSANIPYIIGATIPLLIHYWSLGVEEQFYLFWPFVIKNFKKTSTAIQVITASIAIIIVTKILVHFFVEGSILEVVIHVTRFHCMMIGALAAILFKINHSLFLKLVDNKITQGICWLIMTFIILNKFHIASIIDNEIVAVIASIIIIGQINVNNRLINLETKMFNFLGKISYGIYVIHPVIIFCMVFVFKYIDVQGIIRYILVLGSILFFTILVAYISFTYFENYFIQLKKKFQVVKSTASSTK